MARRGWGVVLLELSEERMRTVRPAMLWCLALVASTTPTPVHGETSPQLALLLVKAATYDRNLAERVAERVTVAVAYPSDSRRGANALDAFAPLSNTRVLDKPLEVIGLAFSDGADLTRKLRRANVAFVVAPSELTSGEVADVVSASRSAAVLSLGLSSSVVRAGIGLGVAVEGERPRVFVNLAASKDQGANLSSDLLELAVRVDR